MQLTERQFVKIVKRSLQNYEADAAQFVYEEFCSDCRYDCFPCGTARLMIGVCFDAMMRVQAKLN